MLSADDRGIGQVDRHTISSMSRSAGTLLEPAREAEWKQLSAEKRALLTPPPDTPTGELLRRGQHLSEQAARLLRAVDRGNGHTTRS